MIQDVMNKFILQNEELNWQVNKSLCHPGYIFMLSCRYNNIPLLLGLDLTKKIAFCHYTEKNDIAILETLIEQSLARLELPKGYTISPFSKLAKGYVGYDEYTSDADVNKVDCFGNTELMKLAKNIRRYNRPRIIDAMKFLIDNNADYNTKDNNGDSIFTFLEGRDKAIVEAIALNKEIQNFKQNEKPMNKKKLEKLLKNFIKSTEDFKWTISERMSSTFSICMLCDNITENEDISLMINVDLMSMNAYCDIVVFGTTISFDELKKIESIIEKNLVELNLPKEFTITPYCLLVDRTVNVDEYVKNVDVDKVDAFGNTEILKLAKNIKSNNQDRVLEAIASLIDNDADVNRKDQSGLSAIDILKNYDESAYKKIINASASKKDTYNVENYFRV